VILSEDDTLAVDETWPQVGTDPNPVRPVAGWRPRKAGEGNDEAALAESKANFRARRCGS